MDPAPEPVRFDTVLELGKGEYEIKGAVLRNELRNYYESELTFLRQIGAEFADKYPKIASRLLLEPDRCEDPHVERMLEAFALLAARVHLRDRRRLSPDHRGAAEYPLSRTICGPCPSMSVAQFHTDPEQGKLTSSLKIPKGTVLYSRPVEGVPCKFRTSYDVTLWPFKISQAQWMTPDRIRPAVTRVGGRGPARRTGMLPRCFF